MKTNIPSIRITLSVLAAGIFLLSLTVQAEEESGSGIGDALNAEWGAYRYQWGGQNYYNIDKTEDAESPEAEAAVAEEAAATEKEPEPRRKSRSLRSGGSRSGLMSGEDAPETDGE